MNEEKKKILAEIEKKKKNRWKFKEIRSLQEVREMEKEKEK